MKERYSKKKWKKDGEKKWKRDNGEKKWKRDNGEKKWKRDGERNERGMEKLTSSQKLKENGKVESNINEVERRITRNNKYF